MLEDKRVNLMKAVLAGLLIMGFWAVMEVFDAAGNVYQPEVKEDSFTLEPYDLKDLPIHSIVSMKNIGLGKHTFELTPADIADHRGKWAIVVIAALPNPQIDKQMNLQRRLLQMGKVVSTLNRWTDDNDADVILINASLPAFGPYGSKAFLMGCGDEPCADAFYLGGVESSETLSHHAFTEKWIRRKALNGGPLSAKDPYIDLLPWVLIVSPEGMVVDRRSVFTLKTAGQIYDLLLKAQQKSGVSSVYSEAFLAARDQKDEESGFLSWVF